MFRRVELLCVIVNSFFGLSLFLEENNIVVSSCSFLCDILTLILLTWKKW